MFQVGDIVLVKDWNWRGDYCELRTITAIVEKGISGYKTENVSGIYHFLANADKRQVVLSVFPPITIEQAYFLDLGG